ncbi:MAG: hypothetical protein ABI568_12870 [Pseudarthrobacter sp.]
MLIQGYGGKFATIGQPRIRPRMFNAHAAVNFSALTTDAASLPADEEKYLMIVASIAGAEQVSLGPALRGLRH